MSPQDALDPTTEKDATDVGVPMLPGDAGERVGPEDALGEGPKRGDYSKRLGGTTSTTTERIPDAKPGESQVRVVEQNARAGDQEDIAGRKGGVETA